MCIRDRIYIPIPNIVNISIITGITNTNNTELMVTSPVANGKSEPASFATIGNTAITGPAAVSYTHLPYLP